MKLAILFSLSLVEARGNGCRTGWKTITTNDSVRCVKAMENSQSIGDTSRSRTWTEAEKDCQGYTDPEGHLAHLVSVHSQEELNELKTLFGHDDWHYWIGLRMNCAECPFQWSDHSPFDFENWRPGEPNNMDDKEHCVEMDGYGDMGWNDNKCSDRLSYICAYYLDGNPIQPPK